MVTQFAIRVHHRHFAAQRQVAFSVIAHFSTQVRDEKAVAEFFCAAN